MKRPASSSSASKQVKRKKKSKSKSKSKSSSSLAPIVGRSSSSSWGRALQSEEGNIGYNQMMKIARDARLYSDMNKLIMVPYHLIFKLVHDYLAAVDQGEIDIADEKEIDKVGALHKLIDILVKKGVKDTVLKISNLERREHVMRVIASGLQAIYINIWMNTSQSDSDSRSKSK